ncbi:MAG: PKD domain-containing protein, partial [Deltaproteobacteria bacterium]|nr:PKD domain-containing protein [Deltaproteobacteria bacterium]
AVSFADGSYQVMHQCGTYTLSVRADGYDPWTSKITVIGTEVVTRDIALTPVRVNPLPPVDYGPAGPASTVSTTTTATRPLPEDPPVPFPVPEPTTTTALSDVPVVEVDFAGSPAAGPCPLEVRFGCRSTGDILACEWDFGDGEKSTSPKPAHRYRKPGTYTVSLMVYGNDGRATTETKRDYIQARPGCVFSALLKNKVCLETLRRLRDERLGGIGGQILKSVIVNNSAELIRMFSQDSDLSNEFRRLVADNIVFAQTVAGGRTAVIPRKNIDEIVAVIRKITKSGSLKLQLQAALVVGGIQSGFLPGRLGIRIE